MKFQKDSPRPIVLIRGLLREQRHWGDFRKQLCKQYPHRPVICLDLAGNGARFRVDSPSSIRKMVNDLRVQLRLEEINPYSIDIVAISMGGMIAIEWITCYPNEVDSAVLINTSTRPYSPFYQRLNWRQLPTIFKIFHSSPERKEALILSLTSNNLHQHQGTLKDWVRWREQYPVSSRNTLAQLQAAARYRVRYSPTKPVLLLASEQDQLVNVACSKALAAHWHLPLFLHPNAGHDLPLDEPEWVCEQIEAFFQQRAL
ncbi:alpha/beta fold hydrolase [Photobacterium chitinilyticum]|uniref:Alpha/beta hydrolase n=1 Tax=Photobacterium chitinilyticum TaxID=2485123 RepID=A0A444JIC2_9GAMM|nr:alpha/beta hydrolase [Photobacterium chitinilyticum]RWX52821.1 alpha/beta hydrolase [Photobacterium chitinilyticum]